MKIRKKMNLDDFPELEIKRMQVIKGGFQFYDPTYNGGNLSPVDVYPGGGNNDPWGGQYDPWANGGSSSVDYPGDYGNNGGYDNSNDKGTDDPWKKDANGNILSTATGRGTHNDSYGNTLIMSEHKIQAKDGTEIVVFKVETVIDSKTGEQRLPTEAEKSNCFGRALTGGDYWLGVDDPLSPNVNEQIELEKVLDKFYEPTNKDDATLVIVEHGIPYHAGIINADGTFTAKGGIEPEDTYRTIEEFRAGNYEAGELKYYKLK